MSNLNNIGCVREVRQLLARASYVIEITHVPKNYSSACYAGYKTVTRTKRTREEKLPSLYTLGLWTLLLKFSRTQEAVFLKNNHSQKVKMFPV